MKEIHDTNTIQYYLDKYDILSHFSSRYDFYLATYDKQETIIDPLRIQHKIMFVVEGTIHLYMIHEDGKEYAIHTSNEPLMLGDLEFVSGNQAPVYCDAIDTVVCVVLDTTHISDKLHHDFQFLNYLLSSIAGKLYASTSDVLGSSLKEKIINYMGKHDGIESVKKMYASLHVSRRQAQRVLKQLCEEKEIERIGKGKYRFYSGG